MLMYSAIIFYTDDGYPVMITGKRHAECFNKANKLGLHYDLSKTIQGFLTDQNIFLDRFDAKPEARKCRQLIVDTESRELYSDDIWPAKGEN